MDYKELMRKIITLSILHRYYIQQNASAAGMYAGQPRLLEYLVNNGESFQKDIAAFLHVSPASVAVSIKRMEKNGLVSRTADSEDMRRNKVVITDSGRKAIENFYNICNELDAKVFNGLSAEELISLEAVLDKMNRNLLDGRVSEDIMQEFGRMNHHSGCDISGDKKEEDE